MRSVFHHLKFIEGISIQEFNLSPNLLVKADNKMLFGIFQLDICCLIN